MFHGSILTDMCRIVREHVSLWSDVTDVYNACCGNFTVERTIALPRQAAALMRHAPVLDGDRPLLRRDG
ncbi:MULTISPECIES: hypothetical protein [unclassified Nonomuraea]|uniref:putative antirestriction adenine methyltransferase n=1 Tax=unclassified Nonomuraea TaxID=2593643 RepID=UPI0034036944